MNLTEYYIQIITVGFTGAFIQLLIDVYQIKVRDKFIKHTRNLAIRFALGSLIATYISLDLFRNEPHLLWGSIPIVLGLLATSFWIPFDIGMGLSHKGVVLYHGINSQLDSLVENPTRYLKRKVVLFVILTALYYSLTF